MTEIDKTRIWRAYGRAVKTLRLMTDQLPTDFAEYDEAWESILQYDSMARERRGETPYYPVDKEEAVGFGIAYCPTPDQLGYKEDKQ